MRSVESQDGRALRRFRAWELHEENHWPQCRIAEALGVTQRAVSQGIKRGIEGGSRGAAAASTVRRDTPPR